MDKKTHIFKVINIVAHPRDKQTPETYINAFNSVLENKQVVMLTSENNKNPKAGILTKFEPLTTDSNEVYIGEFSIGTYYGDEVAILDTQTLKQKNSQALSSIFLAPKDYSFWFHSQSHRIIIPKSLPIDKFVKFLQRAFARIKPPIEIVVTPVWSKQVIDEILNSTDVVRLYIETNYTNNDNNEAFASLIDGDNRTTGVSSLTTTAKADKGLRINIKDNRVLSALLSLCRENGYAKANVEYDDGTVGTISTKKHHEELPLEVGELARMQESDITDLVLRSTDRDIQNDEG